MRRTLLLASALLLICVPLARAKGFEFARACGAGEECRTTQLHDRMPDFAIPPEATVGGAPSPAPWYRVRLRFTGAQPGQDLKLAVLADRTRVAWKEMPTNQYVWYRIAPYDRRAYARFTRGLEPLPAKRMPASGVARHDEQPALGSSGAGGGGSIGGDGDGGGFPWAAAVGVLLASLVALLALGRRLGVPAALSGYILGPRSESEEERHANGERHQGAKGVGGEQVGRR
jgi:hypothetical protein